MPTKKQDAVARMIPARLNAIIDIQQISSPHLAVAVAFGALSEEFSGATCDQIAAARATTSNQ